MSLYACYAQPDLASPKDNTDVVMTLPNSSFPLAQCMGLEVSERFGLLLGLVSLMHVLSQKILLIRCMI